MKNNQGFLMVEVLLAIVILSMIFLTMFTTLSFITNRTERARFDSQAAEVMQEGVEVARSALLSNWTTTSEGEYHPVFNQSTNTWSIAQGSAAPLKGRFTRTLTVSAVCRQLQGGERVTCPGQIDNQSRLITVKVEWKEGTAEKEIEASLLLFKKLQS